MKKFSLIQINAQNQNSMEDRVQLILENRNKICQGHMYITSMYFFQSILTCHEQLFSHYNAQSFWVIFVCMYSLPTLKSTQFMHVPSWYLKMYCIKCVCIRYDLSFDVFHKFPSVSFLYWLRDFPYFKVPFCLSCLAQ